MAESHGSFLAARLQTWVKLFLWYSWRQLGSAVIHARRCNNKFAKGWRGVALFFLEIFQQSYCTTRRTSCTTNTKLPGLVKFSEAEEPPNYLEVPSFHAHKTVSSRFASLCSQFYKNPVRNVKYSRTQLFNNSVVTTGIYFKWRVITLQNLEKRQNKNMWDRVL